VRRLDLYRRGRGGGPPGNEERGTPGLDRSAGALEELRRRVGGEPVARGGASVLEVRRFLPFDALHGGVRLGDLFGYDPSLQQVLFPRAALVRPGELLFFDLETTGLSGGAGTHDFLAGFLSAVPDAAPGAVPDAVPDAAAPAARGGGFELVQYFLPTYASERLFLELIDRLIAPAGALVSYNGRCFDAGVLRTRHVMCGMAVPWEPGGERAGKPAGEPAGRSPGEPMGEPAQFDLLYPCRRIWRGMLPDHTLGTVERELLGVTRERDLPGWMVPQVYTDFLAGRASGERLAAVFEHNRNDVLSLLALLVRQLGVVSGAAPLRRYNPVQVSRMLAYSRRGDQARRVLSEHRDANEALRHLGLLHRREGDYRRALSCFEELAGRASGLSEYLFACTEAAKIYEHRLGDPAGALAWTIRMRGRLQRAGALGGAPLGTPGGREPSRVEHRFRRLRGKLERKSRREGA
jgi:hypothetical protein